MTNIPKIRFRGFTDPWEQRKVSDMFKVTRGYVLPVTKTDSKKTIEKPYPVYSSQTLNNGLMGYYSEYLYKDAITWTTDGANAGTVRFRPDKFYCTNVCGVLLSNNNPVNKMIAEALNNVAWKHVSYVGNPKLMNNVMSDIEIKIPTKIDEQNRISELFDQLDNLITFHQLKYDKLINVKKSMLEKMFPKNGNNVPEIRFKGFADPWVKRKVSEYASLLTGNGLNWGDISKNGKQECILYGNLYTDYGMIADKVVCKTNAKISNPVYSEYGDVLIPASDTTPTGLARATSIEKSGVLLGGGINIIRPNKEINGSCLSLSLNANKKELISLIKGTTVRHIYNTDIKDILVYLPKTKDEQIKISEYFKNIDALIIYYQNKYNKLVNIKKAMLDKMFI